jgi:hypothetical protein
VVKDSDRLADIRANLTRKKFLTPRSRFSYERFEVLITIDRDQEEEFV